VLWGGDVPGGKTPNIGGEGVSEKAADVFVKKEKKGCAFLLGEE